jgi:Rho GTPase-activating protein 1
LPKSISSGQTRLPRVLREATTFILLPHNIRTEGLFRIPPHTSSIGILKEAYNRGQKFIIWKEKGAVFAPPGIDHSLVDEISLEDAYGVHLAASLIKAWYRDLREPIFMESSYNMIRERFRDPSIPITLEDLAELLLPSSKTSPLFSVAREILSRHLLPMLAEVALHEANNKMNAENLAICFSMCLVCGSNQLEDGKMSMVIKRIIQAAIENWPALRKDMGLEVQAFNEDIDAPKDHRDHEDPLEAEWPAKASYQDDTEGQINHRIFMQDDAGSTTRSPDSMQAPPLPVRRTRATSTMDDALNDQTSSFLQQPPPVPKRRPAASAPSRAVTDPPRYSTVFDADGVSIHSPDSPIMITPADGFAQARPEGSRYHHYDLDMKTVAPIPVSADAESHTTSSMPRRKAVPPPPSAARNGKESVAAAAADSPPAAVLARMAAQQAATNQLQRLTISPTATAPNVTISPADPSSTSSLITSAHSAPPLSRQPSFPTPSSTSKPMEIHSLTKPVHGTTPAVILTHPTGNEKLSPVINNTTSNSNAPRHRAPSAGLLKRMASMESLPLSSFSPESTPPLPQNSTFSTFSPPSQTRRSSPKLQSPSAALKPDSHSSSSRAGMNGLRKTSVEDLRRIYEERASTVGGLERVVRGQRSGGLSS